MAGDRAAVDVAVLDQALDAEVFTLRRKRLIHGTALIESADALGQRLEAGLELASERSRGEAYREMAIVAARAEQAEKAKRWIATNKIADLGPISPRHEEIEPLQAIARTFVSRDGYWSSGYVLLPRGHRAADRHPAVVVTHGTDADDRFAEPANQWNYPVQLLAERGYATGRSSYDAVYGGAPLSDNIERWRRFAPSLNADKVCAAVLQQVASASPSQIELFEALRAAGVATQISYYPGATAASDETHVFYLTTNRLRAMRENIAWFDYWLLDKRDADAPFPDHVVKWDRMKKNLPDRCAAAP